MTSHEAALNYFYTGQIPSGIENVFYSANRSESVARLSVFYNVCKNQGIASDNDISLIVSSLGELTNNCFDHNLGYWHDTPGCCVSWSKENNVLTFCIADRGRGIVETLKRVTPANQSAQEILQTAFEKVISGRAPEKRGNGLKYVCRQILSNSLNALKCFSNNCSYQVNSTLFPVPLELSKPQDFGTIIFFQWRIS
ncbi:MAG: ATP-binding protein [Bdellovibrionaceae bacterium]|nr:ATP-binding protein [Bdellovibrio sp.]